MIRLRHLTLALGVLTLGLNGATQAQQSKIDRGGYLVNTVMTCHNCHTPMGPNGRDFTKAFSGGQVFDEPPFKVTGANITQDKETGIGGWTDAQIKTLMRTGVRPNGVPVAAIMPTAFYGIMTESDMDAIVAYLRTVKPIKNAVPDPIYKMQIPHIPFPGSEKPYTEAMLGDKLKKGFYLATAAHCMECHTPFGARGRDFTGSLGKGGFEFPGPWGISVARNITSSRDQGIGAWSDAEIKTAITTGVRKDGTRLKPPMGFPLYAGMTGDDLDAVIAYLRTVPVKE